MKIFLLFVCFLTVGCNPLGCGVCELDFCPQNVHDCPLGVTADPCGCCPIGVCLLTLGSRCLDLQLQPISQTDFPLYTSCGEFTVCKLRNDLAEQRQSICECVQQGPVCGTDNITYSDVCSLHAAVSNVPVNVAHLGACAQPPRISVGPVSKTIHLGQNIALDCEAHGVPVPTLTWQFHGRDGPSITLPADNEAVVVQTRGGPESSTLTSWVQVLDAGPQNAGAYVCVAENEHGITQSATMLTIQ